MSGTGRRNLIHSAYTLAVIMAGLGVLISLFEGLDLDRSSEFAVLIILGILVEWLAVNFPMGRLSGSFSLILASLLIYNLNASAWISSVAFFIGNGIVNRGNPVRTSLFNTSQQVLTIYASVYLTRLVWGRDISGTLLTGINSSLAHLVILIALYFMINHVFVYLYMYPGRNGARMHSWKDSMRWDALSYFFSVPFGAAMAVVYQKTGMSGVLLLFVPLLTVQFVLRRYVRSELVNKELRAVYEISLRLGARPDFQEIPAVLLREMHRVVAFHTGVVYLWDEKDRLFKAAAAYGPYREQLEKDYIIPGEGFNGWVINNGEPEIIFNARTDPRVKSEQGLFQVLRSLMIIPLVGQVGSLGLIVVGEKNSMVFGEADLQAVMSLCGTLNVTLTNRVLAERLDNFRNRDPLTGLLNRAAFYRLCRGAFSGEGEMALVAMDIDMLGHINEGWGQQTGDRMIADLGRFLKSVDIPEMQAGRYGDDEFALLLPGFDEQKALALVREIKGELDDYVFDRDYPLLRIKISAGIAVAPGDGVDLDELLKSAAKALKQAKKSGRDRIVTSSDLKGRYAGRSNWLI